MSTIVFDTLKTAEAFERNGMDAADAKALTAAFQSTNDCLNERLNAAEKEIEIGFDGLTEKFDDQFGDFELHASDRFETIKARIEEIDENVMETRQQLANAKRKIISSVIFCVVVIEIVSLVIAANL